jgi:hypothetical protein
MKIIDTNILNKFAKKEIALNVSESFYVTEDLKNEIENFKAISLDFRNSTQTIKFIDATTHRYYNEAKYLENYQKFINVHNKIVSFYGLKGFGDISILAYIGTIIQPVNPTLFGLQDSLEIITNDSNLKEALKNEFDGKVIITDPLELK